MIVSSQDETPRNSSKNTPLCVVFLTLFSGDETLGLMLDITSIFKLNILKDQDIQFFLGFR